MFDLLKKFNWIFRLCGFAFIVIAVHGFMKGNIGIGLVYLTFLVPSTKMDESVHLH